MSRDLDIGILSPLSSLTADDLYRVIACLVAEWPEAEPEAFDSHEPLRERFQIAELRGALSDWRPPFLWKRRRPPSEGSIWWGYRETHSVVFVSTVVSKVHEEHAIKFLLEASSLLRADLAYMSVFSRDEASSPRSRETFMPFRTGLTTHDLRKGLPNLPWGVLFGPAYVKLLGAAKLLSSPVFQAKSTGEAQVWLQLTERTADCRDRVESFSDIREKAKAHIGESAFISQKTGERASLLPQFFFE